MLTTQIIQMILLCYTMEGIKPADVAMLISTENGATVFRCMAPQQHNATRAVGVKQRLERKFDNDHAAEVMVQPGQFACDGGATVQAMHTVVVHYFAKHS